MAYYVKNLNDYCEKCVAENVSMFQGSERWGLLVNSPAGTVMIVDTERDFRGLLTVMKMMSLILTLALPMLIIE